MKSKKTLNLVKIPVVDKTLKKIRDLISKGYNLLRQDVENVETKLTTGTDPGHAHSTSAPTAHAANHEIGGSDLISHDNITGKGSKSHSQIDSHLNTAHAPSNADKTDAENVASAGAVMEEDMVAQDMLEKDTEVWVIIGPLISSLDGTDPARELVLGDITAAIYKGVTRSVLALSGSNFVEMSDGYIKLKLTASNTDTTGRLVVTLRDDDVFLGKSKEFWVK